MNTYTDLVYNLAKSINAWKLATVVLALVTLAAIFGMSYLATHQTTLLVPENIASARGPVKVKSTAGFDPGYLGYLATADAALVLDWTPDDVSSQFTRFLNRVTPEFYAAQQVQLMASALDHAKASEVQTFYPLTVKSLQADTLQVQGTLVRWIGDKQVFHQAVSYTITYVTGSGGLPYVSSFVTSK